MRWAIFISLLVCLNSLAPGSLALCAPRAASPAPTVDHIVVLKSARIMRLYSSDNKIVKEYRVALGRNPVGAKQRQGDSKTPEGTYTIDRKNQHSQFHLSLRVSYPSAQDRQRAQHEGVDPGGDIMIHGLMPVFSWLGPLHRQHDWTDGCIAVTNAEIEEIWSLVPVGTRIEIRP
jgi:murein L,D-transpeptidase YafK